MFDAYPLQFEPIFSERIWGGDKLATVLGRDLQGRKNVGESWDISDRPEAQSVVANGSYKGKTLNELVQNYPKEMLGKTSDRFPLLIKFVDARDRLSLQVHPDDSAAKKLGSQAKTEAWYIVSADDKAELILGLKQSCSVDEFKKAVADNTVETMLEIHSVKSGDFFFVPAGAVHSTGAGILFAEIQQNSDTTFRIFDWNRKKPDGSYRELHIDQAMESLHWQKGGGHKISRDDAMKKQPLIDCEFFRIELCRTVKSTFQTGESFHVLMGIGGEGKLSWAGRTEPMHLGSVFLLPAALGDYEITAESECETLIITDECR